MLMIRLTAVAAVTTRASNAYSGPNLSSLRDTNTKNKVRTRNAKITAEIKMVEMSRFLSDSFVRFMSCEIAILKYVL